MVFIAVGCSDRPVIVDRWFVFVVVVLDVAEPMDNRQVYLAELDAMQVAYDMVESTRRQAEVITSMQIVGEVL